MAGKNDPYADEVASAKRLLAEKAYDEQPWSEWAGDVVGNAVNTARSVLPTALGGRGEVGITDIARGAYEAGKDAVTFPGDVITGKQALFDEAGRPLEQAVGRSFNTAATVGGASSMVPVPDNSLRVFGGIKSLTADKDAMRDAMKMESKGATPDEIWDNTGWFRGADGRWRYEIPDIGTTVNSSALQLDLSVPSIPTPKSAKLGDYLQHPEFFAAYPQFKSMDVRTVSGDPTYLGMYYPRYDRGTINPGVSEPRITLNESLLSDGGRQRSVLLHEIQHAIQQKEGFAPGTNVGAQPFDRVNPKFERYNEAVLNDPDMQNLIKIQGSDEYKSQVRKSNALFSENVQPKLLEIMNSSLPDIEKDVLTNRLLNEYRAENNRIAPLVKELEDLRFAVSAKNIPLLQPKEFFTPEEAYFHYAGETEARNVQNRRNLRKEDLRGTRPWDTQEYPYMDQILPLDNNWRKGYAYGGEVDDDIDDALRIAKDVGGSTPVMMEDAKGNKYDAQGNIIPPQSPGPNPARSDMTPEQVGRQAAQDPATYDALLNRYAIPDRDIAEYEALRTAVGQQPQDIQQMTHVGDRPRREVAVDMPLFGGEYSMGTAPYDVASGMQGAAQTAYDLKTAPFYFNPFTAPIAAGMDLAGGIATNDPLTASLAVGFGPGGKYAKAAGVGAVNYFMDPAEAQAGPERWFSKLYRSAEALPMEKMTGEQALAMLRKTAPQEEIKWTGLEGFASENPVTTKKALLDFLKRNQVQTQDVVLGGSKADVPAEIKEKWAALVDRKNEIVNQIVLPPSERTRPWDELMAEQESVTREMDELNEQANKFLSGYTPTRYGPGSQFGEKYMTPGGENYQETLITLPTRDIYTPYIGALRDEAYSAAYKEAITSGIAEDRAADFAEKLIGKMQPYQHARIVNKTKELNEITLKQEMLDKAVYKSQHWDEKNVIGHIRSQMLTANPPGANRPLKLFNVDENQSDLGQAGRKQGFVTIEDRMNYPNMGKQYDAMNAQRRKLETLVRYGDDANPEVQVASGQLAELDRQMQALSDKMASIRGGGVPAAPYVTSTQGWTDFSIKKALDQAIDSGADYFTFTPGEVQAKRYSLRNEVQGLAYDPEEKTLSFYPKDGRGWQDVKETIPPEDLKKYIGEEASKKLLAQEPNSLSGNQILEGIDLEFGGEGMIDYYNKIYKKRVEKVVKDLTGKKIQWEVLPAETSEGIVPRLGFRIDDDLREAKFPTFASGGVVNKALQLTRDY